MAFSKAKYSEEDNIFNDNTDTYTQSSADINWSNPVLEESEKAAIKNWTTTSDSYDKLLWQSSRINKDIIESDEYIRSRYEKTIGCDMSRLPDPKGDYDALGRIQKLRNIIHFAYYNNSKLGKESLIFDMWASWELQYKYQINILTKDIECDGKVVDPEELYHDSWMTYTRALGVGINNKEQFISLLLNYLRDNKVNPWLKLMNDNVYLVSPEEFMAKHGFDPNRMCEFITGDDRELQQFLWLVQFTGVMARTYKPGCQHDHILVLMSAEKGQRKTSFLREIAKDPASSEQNSKYYVQLRTLKSDKKDVERLRGKIIVNLDECDSAFRGANSDDLKEAISSRSDNYRASYGRVAKDWDRTCVVFGTTNTTGLIQDYSGDRRIFIVHVKKQIDTDWVKDNWADFWGFYKWAYNQMEKGDTTHYRNWLNKTEEDLVVANQSEYKAREPWLDALEGVMDVLEQTYPAVAIKSSDILAVIGSEIESKKRYISDHIKDILKAERGYTEGRPRLLGGKQPSKPVMYLLGADEDKPYLASREDIYSAYQSYLKGIYPEDKPANRRNAEAFKATQVNPEVILNAPSLLPPAPVAVLLGTEVDPDDTPF
ncbi:VapE domain-containing protein [Nostoc sp.]|uniref:VapE domain-containing protein n=1 Tax=Nostoc sp. TaxID=1180 RepID=UPI002FFB9E5C